MKKLFISLLMIVLSLNIVGCTENTKINGVSSDFSKDLIHLTNKVDDHLKFYTEDGEWVNLKPVYQEFLSKYDKDSLNDKELKIYELVEQNKMEFELSLLVAEGKKEGVALKYFKETKNKIKDIIREP